MPNDVWRYACPEGHRDISRRGRGVTTRDDGKKWYYCRTCSEGYDGKPVDLKREKV